MRTDKNRARPKDLERWVWLFSWVVGGCLSVYGFQLFIYLFIIILFF